MNTTRSILTPIIIIISNLNDEFLVGRKDIFYVIRKGNVTRFLEVVVLCVWQRGTMFLSQYFESCLH